MASKMNDDFMQAIINEAAWKNLSENFQWTEELLEKHQNDVDWDKISGNHNILWTIPMIQKFSKRINWKEFSEQAGKDVLTPLFIETFKDMWDWKELSRNWDLIITEELLFRYADLWDWERIINRCRSNDVYDGRGIDFYEKFRDYIPASKLQNSSLWDEMVEQRKMQLTCELVS